MRKLKMLRTEPGLSLGFRATDVSSLTLVSDGEKSRPGKGGGAESLPHPRHRTADLGFCRAQQQLQGCSSGGRRRPEEHRGALIRGPRTERRQRTPRSESRRKRGRACGRDCP